MKLESIVLDITEQISKLILLHLNEIGLIVQIMFDDAKIK
jgi:hypothetical protein